MVKFEVGKRYPASDRAFDPITVISRTEKTITVRGGSGNTWRMLIRDNGKNEWARDSSVPVRWRDAFIYSADEAEG